MAEHAVTTKLVSPDRKKEFSWAIDNVSKFSRRLYSSSFSVGRECEHRFQMVARLSQAHPDAHVSSVSIGFMRTDSLHGHATVSCEVQLFNSEGDRYCHKECRWYISKSESRFACSEMFSDYPEKLVLPGVKKNISFKDDHEMICLKGKRLVGSYGDFNKIFILPKDKLIVMGHIKIFGCCPTLVEVSDAKERKRLQPDVDQLLLDFRQAYENEIMTDVELVVGERIIKAHKLVLFSRSPVFRSMFEYNTSEKKDSVIYMDDINSDVMEALVWYLYTATVRDLPYQDVCDLYEAADKYIVPTLQKACFEILMSSIEIPTVCRIMVLAYLHNDDVLKDQAIHFVFRNFAKVKVTEEWEVTVRGHPEIASDVLEKGVFIVECNNSSDTGGLILIDISAQTSPFREVQMK